MARLAHAIVEPTAPLTGHALLLHGILGSGANLRTLARRVVEARPGLAAVLVDLRLHGASRGVAGPHTVQAAAHDVADLCRDIHANVTLAVGHSFGGKVLLSLLGERLVAPRAACVLDSCPGPRPTARGSESTVAVIALLRRLARRFESRAAFVEAVVAEGQERGLAQWLSMNLVRDGDGLLFGVDLDGVEALLADYFAVDLWPVVEQPPEGTLVHMIVGGRSSVLDGADRERLSALARERPDRCRVTVLEGAGHWVHVDDPDGVFGAINASM